MRFIRKSALPNAFSNLLDQALQLAWLPDQSAYPKNLYEIIYRGETKSDLLAFLLPEQNFLCCYCLRYIGESKVPVNLEHIIPNKADEKSEARDDYEKYRSESIEMSRMVHKKDFRPANSSVPPNRYPHDIAYHNLIVACERFDHCFCEANNKRGNRFLPTFTYYPTIEQAWYVGKSGKLFFTENTFEQQYLDSGCLNLNHKRLNLYRATWRFAVTAAYQLNQILEFSETERKEFLFMAMDKVESQEAVFELNNNGTWNEFLRYRYFYSYFQNQSATL